MLVGMDWNIRGYYGVLSMVWSFDVRFFDEWESIPMITPLFYELLRIRF